MTEPLALCCPAANQQGQTSLKYCMLWHSVVRADAVAFSDPAAACFDDQTRRQDAHSGQYQQACPNTLQNLHIRTADPVLSLLLASITNLPAVRRCTAQQIDDRCGGAGQAAADHGSGRQRDDVPVVPLDWQDEGERYQRDGAAGRPAHCLVDNA